MLLSAACGEDDPAASNTTLGQFGGLNTTTGMAPAQTAGTPTTTTGTPTTTTGTPTTTTGTPTTTTGTPTTTTGTSTTTTGTPTTTTGADGGVNGGGTTSDGGTTSGETDGGGTGDGSCCSDGDCICRGEAPTGLIDADGPYATESYDLSSAGCVYYPTDAEPPFAAVAISDGFLGSGGCGFAQTSGWGPFYASHGIVAMIVHTTGGDQPPTRGDKLLNGIDAFKTENQDPDSPLYQKLAGRYGTSGFSMGGGGTTHATTDDPSLLSSVALMPWNPVGGGISVPTLFLCDPLGDPLAACPGHSNGAYAEMPSSTPKMIVEFGSGHDGQPDAAGGQSGAIALAFQKYFLEGDERWKSVLLGVDYRETTVQ